MSVVVVVGAQWGDEGKGKIVDAYAAHADVVVRYGGGANAGHTLVVGGDKVVLHLVPSGVLQERTECLLGQGMVIDPATLLEEISSLEKHGVRVKGRLFVSERAHVVMPIHKIVDAQREAGPHALGTTKRGIGPAYEDKVARRGIRIGDMMGEKRLADRVARSIEQWSPFLGDKTPTAASMLAELTRWRDALGPFIADAEDRLAVALEAKKRILLEGAQGTLLDIDAGTYPFVTSSSTLAGGACAGAAIGPSRVDGVVGVTKAYATRVGHGPFPTELEDATGQRLRDIGGEYGATTGRPRRCGWLDLVALRYAVRVNGLDSLAITKLDVLSGFDTLKLCVGYRVNGKRLDSPPFDAADPVEPEYIEVPGWKENISGCRSREELPANVLRYVETIETHVKCEAAVLSIGPDREQSIVVTPPFA